MESQADYRLTPPVEAPSRYQQEAAVLLLGTVADPSQALTDIIAQLLKKHASDIAWLISQIQLWQKDLAKAEARVKEQDKAATETAHELTYERQMRQQAEEARDKLVRRVKEQQAELSEQEVDKMTLLRELREARAALHNATR